MKMHGALDFLQDYPGMSLGPVKEGALSLIGTFRFIANYVDGPSIEDQYVLKILVPENFPYEIPKVTELEGKIPRDYQHHINPDDTLCVGAPLRITMSLARSPTMNTFAEEFLVPYLYAVSHKIKYGGKFIFGELEHGLKGILKDYAELLDLVTPEQTVAALNLLSMKKRVANKKPCPCECGHRLGKCEFRFKLNEFRAVAPRTYYSKHLEDLKKGFMSS